MNIQAHTSRIQSDLDTFAPFDLDLSMLLADHAEDIEDLGFADLDELTQVEELLKIFEAA